MSEVFLKLVNMSISAAWLVLAVVVLRLFLKKAPKWIPVLLWGIVAVRLLCPISIESVLSLIPSSETIPLDIGLDTTPAIHSGIPVLNSVINPMIQHSNTPSAGDSVNPLQITLAVAANIWVLGAAAMLLYTAVSYLRLRKKLTTATLLRRDVYQSETVSSPFVLGLIKPRIYLPYNIASGDLTHVLAHEQAHIRRKDHWWKPLGFLLLALHWFNPLMWVAYILLCRDIELACDEKVIASLENGQRGDYTQALVSCSVRRFHVAACPLAFGEVGVKDRVKSIMNYRKPAFWIVVASVAVCAAAAVCFLTDPNPSREFYINSQNISGLDPEAIVERILDIEDWESSNVYVNSDNFSLTVDSDFDWVDSQTVRYFFSNAQVTYTAQLRIFPDEGTCFLTEREQWMEQNRKFLLRHYLDAIKYLPQNAIRYMAPADRYIIRHIEEGRPSDYERVITYSPEGVQETNGWYLHLQVQPLHEDGNGYHGFGEEVVELFYGESSNQSSDSVKKWFDFDDATEKDSWTADLTYTTDAFPGTKFVYRNLEITALTSDGKTLLVDGSPVRSAYFCDVTRDGLPEICCETNFGYGMVDNRVVVFDYATGIRYELEDRGEYDYYLSVNDTNGQLFVDKKHYNDTKLIFSEKLEFEDNTIQAGGEKATAYVILWAKLLEIRDGYFLVEPVAGSRELSSTDRIEVPMKNMELSPEPTVGDILHIEYDGWIQESYPARIREVFRIRVKGRLRVIPQSGPMIPTDTDLYGLHAGALLLPIDGKIYRYLLTDPGVEGIAVDDIIYSCIEHTVQKKTEWEVYSLQEYPDLSVVLLTSQTDGAWLCQYSPPGRCSETALEETIHAGNVVVEDGAAIHGKNIWMEFFNAAQQGKAASVTVAHYQTLDPDSCDDSYFEVFNQDYPNIRIYQLNFDGEYYTLSFQDGEKEHRRTYEYLMRYETESYSFLSSKPSQKYVRYVLTHDDQVTWEEIFGGMISSQAGAYIDHFTIYEEKQ